MSDKYVTHDEIDSKFEIYDGKIKSYISLKQSELKSDFIQYVNDIIKNNKANTALITTNMNTRMQAMETKIDIVSEKIRHCENTSYFCFNCIDSRPYYKNNLVGVICILERC